MPLPRAAALTVATLTLLVTQPAPARAQTGSLASSVPPPSSAPLSAPATTPASASAPAEPVLLFRSGFEGETRVIPGAPAEHRLVGRDTTLTDHSDWQADIEERLGFGPARLEYTGGEDTQRFAKIIPEPGNPANRVLWFWLNDGWKADGGVMKSRIQLDLYGRKVGLPEFYQSVRVFLTEDWNALKTYPGKIGWLTIAEFWNDTYWQPAHNPQGFRITPGIAKKAAGEVSDLHFSLNAENPRQREVWRAHNDIVKVPIGVWFTLEYYFKEGDSDGGRFYMAVTPEGATRQVVFDVVGWTRNTNDPTPGGITDWNPLKLYTSPAVVKFPATQGKTLQIYWDDFELWTHRTPTDSSPSRPQVREGF